MSDGLARPTESLGHPVAPAMEWLEAGRASDAQASLLFVHGASAGAWMWAEDFLPRFAAAGRHAVAVSLRGHGNATGRDDLPGTTLAAFDADLRAALARFTRPPVLVGHSLGGLIAQRLIGQVPLAGIVLLASLPPEGMALIGPRLAWSRPALWWEALASAVTSARPPILDATHALLREEGLSEATARSYAGRMVPESTRTLMDAHWPAPVLPAMLAGVPALVLAGERDPMVWITETWRTALYHGAEHASLPEAGHFLQLGAAAPAAAARILDWLGRRGL